MTRGGEKCWPNLGEYGNTSSASLPMALDEAHRSARRVSGDDVGAAR
ncbi:3-oxoacyl-[acyl-carrier-protein] synthase III C-terminal domain-containing protein [Melittangium boletus]